MEPPARRYLRLLAAELIIQLSEQSKTIAAKDSDILYRQAKIDKLTHELATLKRWKFGRSSEQLGGTQISLIEKTIEADIAAIEEELKEFSPVATVQAAPAHKSPSVQRCRPDCPVWTSIMNPTPPPAAVAANSSVSVKMSQRSWTTHQACSR
jgi:hypothetical protein